MALLLPAIASTFAGTVAVTLVYYFLYNQAKTRPLKIWTLAWACYSLRFILELVRVLIPPTLAIDSLYELVALLSGVFLLWGSYAFIGQSTPTAWKIGLALCGAWIGAALLLRWPALLLNLPTFTFLAAAFIATGVIFLRLKDTSVFSKHFAGWTFIIWGLHKADYPFLQPVAWFAPWGYLAGAMLGLIAALAILVIYFEQNRQELGRNEAEFRSIYEQTPIGIYRTAPDGRIILANPVLCRMMGYPSLEALQNTNLEAEFYASYPRAVFKREMETKGQITDWEVFWTRADGTKVLVRENAQVMRSPSGEVLYYQGTVEDITARKLAEAALRESEATLWAFINALPEPAFLLNQAGVIQVSNEALGLSLGIDPSVLVGHNLFDLLPAPLAESRKATFQTVLQTGVPSITEDERAGKYFTNYALPVLDADGHVTRVAIFAINITERKHAEALVQRQYAQLQMQNEELMAQAEELQNAEAELRRLNTELEQRVADRTVELSLANEALARAARLKDEFMASMSHELRTPLTAILGLSEALQMGIYGSPAENQRLPLQNIHQSGEHLLALITDILDLSKIEAGKMELHLAPVLVNEVCQNSLQIIHEMANTKQLQVTYKRDTAVTTLQADGRRLTQMVVNLLSNAVKFTPEGGAIGLEVIGEPANQLVRFTVWDTGIGIAPENISKLFQPFVQLDNRLSRQYAGTGLGLSLVARMAEMHGGSILVDSEVGRGSRFAFVLPWRTPPDSPAEQPPTAEAVSPAPATPGLTQRRALVVEDSTTLALQLTHYLADLGYAHQVLNSSEGAVEQALAFRPDVILLDLLLPAGSGWQVLADLKANLDTQTIPVIITSILEDTGRAQSLGAEGYLVKPIALADLQRALDALRPAPTQPQASPQTSQPLILIADDNEITLLTLRDFLQNQGYRVILARNGGEAVERAREFLPAAILMDIQMPEVDGLEAIRFLRTDSSPQLTAMPIIALTALTMPGDRERCLAAGANDYLSKPVNLTRLVKTLAEQIKLARRPSGGEES